MIRQRTLAKAVHAKGVGLHSGKEVDVTIRPTHADAGIVFRRCDLGHSVKANVHNVVDTQLATTLGDEDVRISTIEHLMAAFAGLGIDNAEVDVSGAELPIMDGSAAPFVRLIRTAGIEEQPAPKRFLEVTREVSWTDGCATTTLSPHDGFRLEYTMNYDHPYFAGLCQHATVDFSSQAFVRDISRARTFGFLSDIERLRAMDLVRGGSLDTAVVVDDDGVLNDEGLRYEDEFVKHKILDAIGDLYVAGHPIIGAFAGYQSGHGANNALVKQLLADSGSYRSVTFENGCEPPISLYRGCNGVGSGRAYDGPGVPQSTTA
ncbi:MAG: UDP-3-O-acyl-N-acetylglucosamine deacetylase [Gammaproteobacteria bacterium]|nr:UDP-3-O-acyl-N-acetylglucosamine deacetylase [Gammaproteobacteria bacterium]